MKKINRINGRRKRKVTRARVREIAKSLGILPGPIRKKNLSSWHKKKFLPIPKKEEKPVPPPVDKRDYKLIISSGKPKSEEERSIWADDFYGVFSSMVTVKRVIEWLEYGFSQTISSGSKTELEKIISSFRSDELKKLAKIE